MNLQTGQTVHTENVKYLCCRQQQSTTVHNRNSASDLTCDELQSEFCGITTEMLLNITDQRSDMALASSACNNHTVNAICKNQS